MRCAARLEGLGTTIFTEMTALAVRTGAINLGQGFPDFPAPEAIKIAAAQAIADDHNQYPVTWGDPGFREAIAAKYASQFPKIGLFTVDQLFGGWQKAQTIHFNDGGVFDQIYQPTK